MSLLQTAYIERGKVPQRDGLQNAIDALGFDCKVDGSYTPFGSRGYLPCVLNGQESGCEIYFETATENLRQFPETAEIVGKRDVAITFRWGGDMAECACVLILSAALAKGFDAVVHYQDDNMVLTADELVKEANVALGSM